MREADRRRRVGEETIPGRQDLHRPGGRRPRRGPKSGRLSRRRERFAARSDVLATYSNPEVLAGRQTLSWIVGEEAGRAAAEVGFGWTPDPTAPDRYDVLLVAYEHSATTGEGLPVSDRFCDSTVYTDPKTNMAFRFWHDVSHVRLGLSFDLVDELELTSWHLSQLERRGYGRETLVWQLLHADLVGQVYVMSLVDRFPLDQGKFVQSCIESGFDDGILAECRQTGSPNTDQDQSSRSWEPSGT